MGKYQRYCKKGSIEHYPMIVKSKYIHYLVVYFKNSQIFDFDLFEVIGKKGSVTQIFNLLPNWLQNLKQQFEFVEQAFIDQKTSSTPQKFGMCD